MSNAVSKHRLGVFALVAAALLIGLATFSSLAQAACAYPDAEQVFAPWNDRGYYQLAPEGGLESGASGWTLQNGAALVADDGDRLHEGEQEETAVSLPFGATATSPPVCVDETTPNFRVMVRNVGDKGAKIRVTVAYEGTLKAVKARNSDVHADIEDGWLPSPSIKLETEHEQERVARITFTGKDPKTAYLVDDLYVDPFARR
jgi:hypothetical protein